MELRLATVPFLLGSSVAVIKDVPAEVCRSCHEPYMAGAVTDRLTELLGRLRRSGAEVSIVSYDATVVAHVAV
jgi:YgiT-type zinc finger domain-containing protein